MKLQRILAFIPACVLLTACGASDASKANADAGATASAAGGSTSKGGASGTSSGTGGATATSVAGSGVGGSALSGSESAGTAGTTGVAGNGAGSSGAGPLAGTGGTASGGSGSGSGSGSGAVQGVASSEDDGADCPVGTIPDALTSNPKLPDPFKKLDGTRITTKAEWRCRREEIRKLAEKFAYGSKPPKPESVTGSVTNSMITVKVTDKGKSTTFNATVKLPTSGSAPYPAIIVYGGAGFGSPLDSGVINSEGVALINYDPYSAGKEGTARTNKQGAFYDIAGSTSTTGLLVAWGWGVSRIIDVIAASDGKILKWDAVGVTGCSRFGKGAFIAGVFDQRVALTMPVESGSAGVPIWRGIPGEKAQSLSSAYGEQPWFGDAFSAFTADPTKAPLDTHEAVAMIAPRGLFIMDNPHIANLGPKSGSVAALAAAEVYKALGVGDAITYYSDVQNGTHCSQRPEWVTPLKDNIQRFLKKTGNAPGVFKISSSAAGKLSDWSDWTAPTLQ